VSKGLRSEGQRSQVPKTQSKDISDIDEVERVEEDLRDVSRARIAISHFTTVSEYVAEPSVATQKDRKSGDDCASV